MNSGLMSAVAQVGAAQFGATPPGYRPVTLSPAGAVLPRYGPRVLRPTPGYGKRRTGGFMATGGAAITRRGAEGAVTRDYGTARAYPAEFAVRPNLMGLAATAFEPVDFTMSGGPGDWKWSGPLTPLIGMVAGATIGGMVKKSMLGGAMGSVIGWLFTVGLIASFRSGAIDAHA